MIDLPSLLRAPRGSGRRRYFGLYGLVALPFLTDLLEAGHLPVTLREWTTEIVVGAMLGLLVRKIRRDFLSVHVLASADSLTGLYNRRAFNEALDNECVRSARQGQPLALVYIDLDNFKQINDRGGHDAGDAVLRQVGNAILHAIRQHVDLGFRLGGDEFALLLPGSDLDEAAKVVARLRAHCRTAFSAGIAQLHGAEAAHAFMCRADDAMYRQKQLARHTAGHPG